MQSPLRYRKGIPFYYDKSEDEFSRDNYERYDDMVVRQTALHLADELWQGYPMQPVLSFIFDYLKCYPGLKIVELGSGVGRLIATLAQAFPDCECWGLDYSYQLLKRAREFWIEEKTIQVDAANKGFNKLSIKGQSLTNLQFGLTKAEALPFDDESQDVLISSFLLERMQNPLAGIEEMYRVLKNGGQLFLVSPLNFQKTVHWQQLYPIDKIRVQLSKIGFVVVAVEKDMIINEPLDVHGNLISWKCLGVVCSR